MIRRVGVNKEYKTINEAYTWSDNGDTLWIDEGTYTEEVRMVNKYVNLVGNNRRNHAHRGQVIIKPPINKNVLYISGITSSPNILIEGVNLKFNIDTATITSSDEVIEVVNSTGVNLIFNRCIINASYKWEYVFQCNTNALAGVTLKNCQIIWKDVVSYGGTGASHFVRSAKDVIFTIEKSILSNGIENISSSNFTQRMFDYKLQLVEGYGPMAGTSLSVVPNQYYFSGSIIDKDNENLLVDSVILDIDNKNSKLVLTNNSLSVTISECVYGTHYGVRATVGRTTGKWYWEFILTGTLGYQSHGSCFGIGTARSPLTTQVGSDIYSWGYQPLTGYLFYNNKDVFSKKSKLGDTIGFAVDCYNKKMWVSINGVWLSGDPSTGVSPSFTEIGDEVFPMVSLSSSYQYKPIAEIIFAKENLRHTIPIGYSFYGTGIVWPLALIHKNSNQLIGITFTEFLHNTFYIETPYNDEHLLICYDVINDLEGKLSNKVIGPVVPEVMT